MRSSRRLSKSGSPKLCRWISRQPQATHSSMICRNKPSSICRMGRCISRCRQIVQRELQALVVSMRTWGGNRPASKSMAPPTSRQTTRDDNFRWFSMSGYGPGRISSSSAQTAGWSEAWLSRMPASSERSPPRQHPIDAIGILGAENLSHGIDHAGRGQQVADLRIVAVGIQIAHQHRRLGQGQKHGQNRAKLLLPFARVGAGNMREQDVDDSLAVRQAHQHGIAIAAAAVVGQGNALPIRDRPRAEQAVAEIQMIPLARVGGEEPVGSQPLGQLARLIEPLPKPRAMNLLQGDEIEPFQALGHAIHVATAVEPLAAVDIEGADAQRPSPVRSWRGRGQYAARRQGHAGGRSQRRGQRGVPRQPGEQHQRHQPGQPSTTFDILVHGQPHGGRAQPGDATRICRQASQTSAT